MIMRRNAALCVIAILEWLPDEVEVKVYGDAAVIRYQARLRIVVRGMPEAPFGPLLGGGAADRPRRQPMRDSAATGAPLTWFSTSSAWRHPAM